MSITFVFIVFPDIPSLSMVLKMSETSEIEETFRQNTIKNLEVRMRKADKKYFTRSDYFEKIEKMKYASTNRPMKSMNPFIFKN